MSSEAQDQGLTAQIVEIFARDLNLEVGPSTDLVDEGLLDSLTFVDLLLQLEQRFGVTVSLEELDFDNFRTVVKIAEIVQRKTAE